MDHAIGPALRLISLGAGVQSTTMTLMGLRGEFGEKPDAAIFADTGWEPQKVYEHLDWLEREVAPFPILHVSKGNLRDAFYEAKTTGTRFVQVPAFVRNPDGSRGMGRRQCTKQFKLEPIGKGVRQIMAERGIARRPGVVEQWIGISLDEAMRMKDSRVGYIKHRWPLIEKRMSRHDCLLWLERNGYPQAPKSACIGCPYHSNAQWREIRENPEEWQQAVEFDRLIRSSGPERFGKKAIGQNFLHGDLIPLDQVDLSTAEERGQINLWGNECEGMCGV